MLVGVALLGLAGVTFAGDEAPAVASAGRVRQYVFDMESAYKKVHDYTAVFYKQERVKGTLQPTEQIELKFRKPLSVYMKWAGDVNPGQEAIYVAGWNGDQTRAHKGSFPDVTVNLRPTSAMAMRGNRHPITDLGIGNTIDFIGRDARLAAARPADNVEAFDLGESTLHGIRVRCIETFAPVKRWSLYYAHHARICYDVKRDLPVRVSVWDEAGELLEDYTFANLKIDPGLTDVDFSPDNPAYGF